VIASRSAPNRTFVAAGSNPARCGEKARAADAWPDCDRPTFRSPCSTPWCPGGARSIRSGAKKRPANGRYNAALRRKLFETQAAPADGAAAATLGWLSPARHLHLRTSSVVRRSEPLSAFGAAALEHEPAIFGGHARAKSVRLGAPAIVRLKGSLWHRR
jgi:hypothetical protein